MKNKNQKIRKLILYIVLVIMSIMNTALGFVIIKHLNNGLDKRVLVLLGLFAFILATTIFVFRLIRKYNKELASGIVVQDEFTKKASVYAGYYAFCASIILWSVYTIASKFIFKDVEWLQKATPVMTITFIITLYTYIICFFYIKKNRKPA